MNKSLWRTLRKKKKGTAVFSLMFGVAMSLAVIFLVLVFSADIAQDVQGTQTANSTAYNVSKNTLNLFANIGDQGGTIGLIVGMAFVLLVLVVMFGKIATSGSGGGRV